jgi:hypothetical protein
MEMTKWYNISDTRDRKCCRIYGSSIHHPDHANGANSHLLCVALPTKQSSNLGVRIGAYLRRMQKAARRGLVGGCERDDAPGCCGTAQAKPSGELPVRRRVRTEIGFGRKERESGGKMSRPPGICWADQGGYCFGLNSWIACYFNYIFLFICPLKKNLYFHFVFFL